MDTATLNLARLVAGTQFSDVPAEVIHEAKRRIADVIGIGMSGSTTQVGKQIREFCVDKGGRGNATVWGFGDCTSPEYAALACGTMTFHLELDDVHRTSHTHPAVSVIPGALALCEARRLSGKDLLLSVILGYEVVIRVGMAVSPSIYVDRVFMAPGTLGVLGTAAAAAKLHNLDAESTARVLGAASFLGPLAPFEAYTQGTAVKETIMGWANFVGLNSVDLASRGFIGPLTAIEGEFGYCKATAEHYDLGRISEGLGKRFEILKTGIKPYACCRQHHTAIDAILELREKHNLLPEDVHAITDSTFSVASRGKDKNPTTIAGAKYSAPYIIAVALTFGQVWREQFSMDLVKDPKIQALASKVDIRCDNELDALYDEKWPSLIEITTKDGRVLKARQDLPKGEPEHPVSDGELREKFMSLACDAVTVDRAEEIWEKVLNLDSDASIADLTRLLRANR